ncbi:MAG: preprotein translocase subunit SecE [Ruminococcaceae bacterium]|nr:preprotein translocase subunit SecE [Oscillospiraceae bacterium]
MAEKNKTTSVKPSAVPVKKEDSSRKSKRSVAKWFKGMKSELKKVIWPTPKQILNNTGISLAMMFSSAIVIWGFDKLASLGVQSLIRLVN